MTLHQAYELAVSHQRSGRFAEAETIYRQILAQRPNDPSCLQMAGLLAYPVLIEPTLTNREQGWGWSLAYSAFALLCETVAFRVMPELGY